MLYLHIPYCHHKCSYCGFFSVAGNRDMAGYVDALCAEIKTRSHDAGKVETVYFGGGTPTRLGIDLLNKIVSELKACFCLDSLVESTIEANPEDLTPEFLAQLSEMHFFNRLSIGIQSFNDRDLRTINRVHNSHQALAAIGNAAASGFHNISIDLIMGLPGQSLDDWRCNLDQVNGLIDRGMVKHLSCYELTVEQGSILDLQLRQGRVALPDEETVAAEYQHLVEWCDATGMMQYEVSNFALPGWHSRHNSRYWDRVPYLGFGAGAHSFDGQRRRWNLTDINAYIAANGMAPHEEELLTEKDAFNEFVMTALRTTKGIDKERLRNLFPWACSDVEKNMADFESKGLVEETAAAYLPTLKGLLQADAMAATLFFT